MGYACRYVPSLSTRPCSAPEPSGVLAPYKRMVLGLNLASSFARRGTGHSLPVPTFHAVICAKVCRRHPRALTCLVGIGVDESPSTSSGRWRGVWQRPALTAHLVARAPGGLGRPTRPPSDSWALPLLPMHRVYTDRVCVFTDSPDSDRVVTREAGTVATVKKSPFAGYDEVETTTSSTHLSLGSGLEENTPRRS